MVHVSGRKFIAINHSTDHYMKFSASLYVHLPISASWYRICSANLNRRLSPISWYDISCGCYSAINRISLISIQTFTVTNYTGRFIMFSYLNVTVHSLRKTKKDFFFTTRDVRCVHHGWHGTHRYDIQVLATHASTCFTVAVNNYIKVGHLVFLL